MRQIKTSTITYMHKGANVASPFKLRQDLLLLAK